MQTVRNFGTAINYSSLHRRLDLCSERSCSLFNKLGLSSSHAPNLTPYITLLSAEMLRISAKPLAQFQKYFRKSSGSLPKDGAKLIWSCKRTPV